jgi:hypothetical protein
MGRARILGDELIHDVLNGDIARWGREKMLETEKGLW